MDNSATITEVHHPDEEVQDDPEYWKKKLDRYNTYREQLQAEHNRKGMEMARELAMADNQIALCEWHLKRLGIKAE